MFEPIERVPENGAFFVAFCSNFLINRYLSLLF